MCVILSALLYSQKKNLSVPLAPNIPFPEQGTPMHRLMDVQRPDILHLTSSCRTGSQDLPLGASSAIEPSKGFAQPNPMCCRPPTCPSSISSIHRLVLCSCCDMGLRFSNVGGRLLGIVWFSPTLRGLLLAVHHLWTSTPYVLIFSQNPHPPLPKKKLKIKNTTKKNLSPIP